MQRSWLPLVAALGLVNACASSPRSAPAPSTYADNDPTGRPTHSELARPVMTRIAADVWVAQVAPGLWVHTTTHPLANGVVYPANGMVLAGASTAVLVDPGWTDAHTAVLVDWTEKTLGRKVTRAVVTHFHNDRAGGIAELARRHISVFVLGATRDRLIAAGTDTSPIAIPGLEKQFWRDPEGFEIYYPGAGHSPDNVVVYFPRQQVLFGGCLVKSVTSLELGNLSDADLTRWPSAIERLQQAYPKRRVIVPGHGLADGDGLARTLQLLAAHTPSN